MQALRRLRNFARGEGGKGCELCGQTLAEVHAHRYHPASRNIRCCCPICVLVPEEGWLEVPRRRLALGADLDESLWQSLGVPVALASFVKTPEGFWNAAYPGPAGLIQTALSDEAVRTLLGRNPQWTELQPHVEAIVVNRLTDPARALLLPIDEHFRLAGMLRSQWRGLSGGDEVWQCLEDFFKGQTVA